MVEEPLLNVALEAYDAEQERQRRERERRLEEQARKDEEDRRLAEAAALYDAAKADPALADDAAAAFEALGEPVPTAAVVVPKATPKIAGVTPSWVDNWKCKPQVDLKKLAAGVASGKYPTTYLLANISALDKAAKACEGTRPIDGVQFYNARFPR